MLQIKEKKIMCRNPVQCWKETMLTKRWSGVLRARETVGGDDAEGGWGRTTPGSLS